MISSKDLRVGNIISVEGEIIIVKSIDECGINYTVSSSYYGSYEIEHDGYYTQRYLGGGYKILPIKLTEEWLRKLGSENGRSFWFGPPYSKGTIVISSIIDYNVQISVGNGGDSSDYIVLPPIKYVHELQNLVYAITGEELEVKR